ncbi:Putative GNAT domain, acyl-CoA N-acyltransferase [Septoria linicola]|uniref:GNAT domain, acyl-CoA N-acyltransferase n=1 Tax=Septoria linicola TaxID=215465 RepID=A0A9Q9AQS7_9PEZI|nr:putative GNAT domain, acyl-CoA N-acyltransferase [Septoria linicola]USW50860.1 Putative GNAT domain, acyl-CoA N-acyltransferase [Septoria linicola]
MVNEGQVPLVSGFSNDEKWQAIRRDIEAWYQVQVADRGQCDFQRLGDVVLHAQYVLIPSEDSLEKTDLDMVFVWYKKNGKDDTIFLYLLDSDMPDDLNQRLLARGAMLESRAHWMWCNLNDRTGHSSEPSNINVRLMQHQGSTKQDLPVVGDAATQQPRTVWHIAALRSGTVLGSCVLNTTVDSDSGRYTIVGGLFNMKTEAEFRRQGVGLALARFACDLAIDLGLRHLYLNASRAGESVYRKVGFESMYPSWTWKLPGQRSIS